jgi:hypothetical protein
MSAPRERRRLRRVQRRAGGVQRRRDRTFIAPGVS